MLALAATMQWVSVTIGFFYVLLTGRPLEATLRDVMKLRGEVVAVAPGALPNDGKVIEDLRRYA